MIRYQHTVNTHLHLKDSTEEDERTVNTPSTPSNSRELSVCGNCRCSECPGPCLSPLSRPPCIAIAAASVTVLPTLNAPVPLHLQLLPTPLSPPTTSEQCLLSCSPTHLYAPRAPPTMHLLPPLMSWTAITVQTNFTDGFELFL